MESQVAKMYENAGVKPLPTCNNCNMLDEYWSNGTYCSTCKCDKDSDECNMANYIYPSFTAEKQIELIKWLAINKEDFGIHYKDYDEEYRWVCGCEFNVEDYLRFNEDRTFEESLAGLINNLWQDLTESEQEQIRSILNG